MQYGAYNSECFENANETILIKTLDSKTWEFQADDLKFRLGEFDADIGAIRTIIEPAYPFIHAPPYVLQQF